MKLLSRPYQLLIGNEASPTDWRLPFRKFVLFINFKLVVSNLLLEELRSPLW